MAKKRVIYTGGTESCYYSDKPTNLVKGKMYEVACIEDRGFHSNYRLAGVKGRFNSAWFDDVPIYLAQSSSLPVLGRPLKNFIRFQNGFSVRVVQSSLVTSVYQMYSNVYEVVTKNSVYLLQFVC